MMSYVPPSFEEYNRKHSMLVHLDGHGMVINREYIAAVSGRTCQYCKGLVAPSLKLCENCGAPTQ